MVKEHSCGAVVFYRDSEEIKYLLIQSRKWGGWSFPKGHVEKGETEKDTAFREIFEETGLKVNFIDGFSEDSEYEFDFGEKNIEKRVTFFVAESNSKEIKLLETELNDFCWKNYEEAEKLVNHKINKEILSNANDFLSEKIPNFVTTM